MPGRAAGDEALVALAIQSSAGTACFWIEAPLQEYLQHLYHVIFVRLRAERLNLEGGTKSAAKAAPSLKRALPTRRVRFKGTDSTPRRNALAARDHFEGCSGACISLRLNEPRLPWQHRVEGSAHRLGEANP